MKPQSTRPRYSAPEFDSQWRKANAEIKALVDLGIKLQSLMPALYEGVLGKEVPDYDSTLEWDDVEETG